MQLDAPYRIVTGHDTANFVQMTMDVYIQAYPKFMTYEALTDPTASALCARYPEYQFGLVDATTGCMVAQGSCLPLAWEGGFAELPDAGCDWALTQGFADHAHHRTPTVLCAVSMAIIPAYRGRSLSQYLIEYSKTMARSSKLRSLILAARPSLKHLYPLIPLERYLTWHNDQGAPFDPWLRVNVQHGGQIVGICAQSMTISDTIARWEARTGMRFPDTGAYVIPEGLVPVNIDYAQNCGTYVEPNVWLYYDLH